MTIWRNSKADDGAFVAMKCSKMSNMCAKEALCHGKHGGGDEFRVNLEPKSGRYILVCGSLFGKIHSLTRLSKDLCLCHSSIYIVNHLLIAHQHHPIATKCPPCQLSLSDLARNCSRKYLFSSSLVLLQVLPLLCQSFSLRQKSERCSLPINF